MGKNTKISFYSSLIFSICIIMVDVCYCKILFISPNIWTSCEKYITNYKFIELFPEIIEFILLPSFLVTINGIISNNEIENTLTAKMSSFFASAFVIIVSVAHFIQFAVIYPNIHSENIKLYELWIYANNNGSLAWGFNYLGWFWGGICTFLIAFKINDKATKILFISYGILMGTAFIGYCIRNQMLQTTVGLAWFVIMPVSFLRVTFLFRKILKGGVQYI